MDISLSKYSSTPPKLYQYPNWEKPAINIVKSRSLLSLSGYKEIIEQKQFTISHLIGLSRPEANYILLDETFYQLLIKEHYKLSEDYSVEIIQEPKLKKLKTSDDADTIETNEDEDFLRELKEIEMELDKTDCEQRNLQLNNNPNNLFPNINQLKHGDIIQFCNERLQFSFYIYQAKKGTFEQLLNKFKLYIQKIIKENNIENEKDNFQTLSTDEHEFILIPSFESDGYGIPSLFNDAPLNYFKHLSPGSMYRWVYVDSIDKTMPIYEIVQKDIELKRHNPTYRTLVREGDSSSDSLINELEDGEEMIIEDLDSFPNAYVFIYDEVKTKLNIEWRKIDSNDYCNEYSSMYLLTKWTQQLQYNTK
ncbi:unnamed protein product [Adineta steineri]|uniref:Uncharacterized protein n=1 Tax=Adineta steineri TaxID=433720 RepID=A0A815TX48_9BILA|nr:unnamed protein product [Adineta steineri]CAF3729526.1 unnamed protein product [Adineta steineri]